MLSIVHCSIVSTTSNSQVDAYVLSESSMFVSKRRWWELNLSFQSLSPFRFILKTCGTTTPLDCIEELTRLVKEFSGFDTVEVRILRTNYHIILNFQEIFYSRKNFQRPDLQKHPHRNFEHEVMILEKYFGAGAGGHSCLMQQLFQMCTCSLLHGEHEQGLLVHVHHEGLLQEDDQWAWPDYWNIDVWAGPGSDATFSPRELQHSTRSQRGCKDPVKLSHSILFCVEIRHWPAGSKDEDWWLSVLALWVFY